MSGCSKSSNNTQVVPIISTPVIDVTPPETPPVTVEVISTISGTISDGPIVDATVIITDASTGQVLGTVQTDSTAAEVGNYTVDAIIDGPVVI